MGWGDFSASYDYVKVLDGETAKLIPLGEPDVKKKPDGFDSILMNVLDPALGTVRLLRCGVVLAGKIKSALKGGKLIGKVSLTIARKGAGMDDTKYTIVKVEELDAKEQKMVKEAELIELAPIPLPERTKGKRAKK